MQKGQIQVLILAGIVLLIAVAGGIFYLGRATAPKSQPQNVATSSPQSSPTLSPTTSPDPTANWKTYTNNKYKFSIKYPPNLVVSEPGAIRFTNEASMPQVIPEKYVSILIHVHSVAPLTDLRGWIEKDTTRNKPDGTVGSIVVGTIENYTSGNLQGFTYHGGAEVDIKHILFKKEDKIFDFTLDCYQTGCTYKDNKDAEKIFNQILSTFKFLP